MYEKARRLGSDDPRWWQEAEAAARDFWRHLKKQYPGRYAEQVQLEFLEATPLNTHFLVHKVSFSDSTDPKRTGIKQAGEDLRVADPTLRSEAGRGLAPWSDY